MTLDGRQWWQNKTNMTVSVEQFKKHYHNDNDDGEFSKKTISLGEFKKCLDPLDNSSGAIGSAGFDLEDIKWIWTGNHNNHHHHDRGHHHHNSKLSGLIYVQLYHEITVADVVKEVPIQIIINVIILVMIIT